jgi:hypothetical protein
MTITVDKKNKLALVTSVTQPGQPESDRSAKRGLPPGTTQSNGSGGTWRQPGSTEPGHHDTPIIDQPRDRGEPDEKLRRDTLRWHGVICLAILVTISIVAIAVRSIPVMLPVAVLILVASIRIIVRHAFPQRGTTNAGRWPGSVKGGRVTPPSPRRDSARPSGVSRS